ncbi:hypothetical protein MUN77_08030 [Leucobacter allii]|uniref:hypothetical protein n=1 Tax=Leucobacter allii TaxID=2932247 RepID=UPI001FD449F4|nr:hypothetical protein [Leucobacter allii]UOR03219.1 hypothetical protein MUN77_08030 [Leucobacter allii]
MPLAPPRYDRLPTAVISSELLRGVLRRCGPGVRSVGWPDGPAVRLAVLAPWSGGGLIAVGPTAAWVWGALREPGTPLHFSTPGARRPRPEPDGARRVHQYGIAEEDVVELASGRRATSPERTACDLLSFEPRFEAPLRVACRLLLSGAGRRRAARERILSGMPRYRRRALARWEAL